MKKLMICFICLLSLLWETTIFGAEEVQSISYVCRNLDGDIRWRSKSDIKNIGPGVYIMTEKARGVYSSFRGEISWVAEMKFERTKDNVRPMSLDKKVYDSKGKLIRRERQEFDLAGNTCVSIHEEPVNNISRTRKFKFNKDAVTRLSLGFYAQKFLENGKTSENIQLVSEEPNLYNVELRLMGKEIININGRKVAAYKLCVDPKLGILDFVKVLLPKSYAWHSAVPKYEWLGYSGLEAGINSEKVEVFIEGS